MRWKAILLVLAVSVVTLGVPSAGTRAALAKCTDPLGCVEIPKGSTLRIATIFSLTETIPEVGIDSFRGVELAVQFRGGTLLGRTIEIASFDESCDPSKGVEAAEQILITPRVAGVVGTTCSGSAFEAAPVLSGAGMSMISPSNTNPGLTDPSVREPFYFRTSYNDRFHGSTLATFAGSLSLGSANTIDDDSGHSDGVKNAFIESFDGVGGATSLRIEARSFEDDFVDELGAVAVSPPDLLFFPLLSPSENLGTLVAQARDVSALDGTRLAGIADFLFESGFLSTAGEDAEGVLATSPDFEFANPDYEDVLDAYVEQYGEPPTGTCCLPGQPLRWHAFSFDATNVLLNAIEAVAFVDGNKLLIPRTALRDAILGTSNYTGLVGNLTCESREEALGSVAAGDCNPNDAFLVLEVQEGEFVPIFSTTE